MANARKRISELPPLNVASLDTTFVLGISGSTTYKISINNLTSSLDGAFATDLVTNALSTSLDSKLSTSSFQSFSSSVHQRILDATNEQSFNGLISGSSQLTSSYDERYVLSGSIVQTTWDNIANKPDGIVSQSTDLSLLNTFTESIDNRVDALELFSSSLNSTFATDLEVSIVSSSVAATIGVISQNTGLVSTSSFNSYTASISTGSLVNRLNAIESVSGSWITESETGSFLTNLNGAISGAAQIADLGFVTGSYAYLTEFNSLTQSFNIISGSVVNITNAVDVTQLNNTTASLNSFTASLKNAIELTGSTVSFLGNIVVYGTQSVINSTNVELSDNILYLSPTASIDNDLGVVGHYNDGTYRHAGIFMDASDGHSWKVFNGLQTETTATVDTSGTGFTLADFKAGVITGTSFNGTINATNGVISGSSQLTSSYDSRYVISGSIGAVPAGTISGSSQLSGTTIQNLSGSFTGSFRGNITGTAAYSDLVKTLNSNTNQDYSLIFTTSGSNGYMQTYTDGVPGVLYNPSTNRLKSAYLQGSIEATNGVISGSSQLTSSFDERYTLSGSISAVPSGTISGSSQLTASFDTRYLLSGSSTSRVFASDTAPSSPTQGDLWWKTDDGNLYVYYDSYWIVATDTISALPSGLISGSAQVTPAWTSAGAVTIGGTTTAPTKGTRTQDNISYRQLGAKQWEVVMTYFQTANTGAANGSGDYLFTLPNSLSFDMTIPSQTQMMTNIGTSSWYNATYVIPSGNGMISNGTTGGKVFPVVYNSTQFRILTINDSAWIKWAGSGHFQFGDNPYVTIQLTFRFTSA